MDKLDASSTSIWEDLFLYRMSLIEEKLSPPGGYREMLLEEGYMGRVSIWNDTCDFFNEVVTYRVAWCVRSLMSGMLLRMRTFCLRENSFHYSYVDTPDHIVQSAKSCPSRGPLD